jgi:hypothetical protein
MYNFLTWVAAQGIKHIPKRWLIQAFNSFKKLPGNQVILKKAKNLWDDAIKKTPTKDLADKVRQKIKPINVPEQTKNILNIKSTLGGRPVRVVPEKLNPLTDALKAAKYKKVPIPKKLTQKTTIDDLQIGPHIDSGGRLWPKFVKIKPKGPAKIIPFPKKPPHLKADGGSIDKALPKRSRDI